MRSRQGMGALGQRWWCWCVRARTCGEWCGVEWGDAGVLCVVGVKGSGGLEGGYRGVGVGCVCVVGGGGPHACGTNASFRAP